MGGVIGKEGAKFASAIEHVQLAPPPRRVAVIVAPTVAAEKRSSASPAAAEEQGESPPAASEQDLSQLRTMRACKHWWRLRTLNRLKQTTLDWQKRKATARRHEFWKR